MRSSQTRSSDHRQDGGAKRDNGAAWSGYNPYFPPVKPEGEKKPQSSTVLFDPYFPSRHRQ